MEFHGLKLDGFQADAVRHIQDGKSVLVAAPTGTGKTLIADYLIEQVLNDGGEVIYTAPIKALSNQKYREYSRQYGEEKVGLVTGDIVINRDAPVRIMTTEILRNILLQEHEDLNTSAEEAQELRDTAPASFMRLPETSRLRAVIVDEIHFVDDPDRGTVWEEMLIYLPRTVRILGLSATLSNLEQFASWLSHIRGTQVEVVRENQRAVPLEFHMVNQETGLVSPKDFEKSWRRWRKEKKENRSDRDSQSKGRGRRDKGRGGRRNDFAERTRHVDVFRLLPANQYPALYFIYSRKMTEQLAFELSRTPVGRTLARSAKTQEISKRIAPFESEYPEVFTTHLKGLLEKGIAFHHAGLHVALKALVEELYEAKLIQVLYCTSTFALGINMPARTVIFDSLEKFDGVEMVPLSVREFMQMAGRAGRRGIDSEGDVVMRMDFSEFSEASTFFKTLLGGRSEPVSSSFNLSFNSVVNLLERYSNDEIRVILGRSFKAYQYTEDVEFLEEDLRELRAAKPSSDKQLREYNLEEAVLERAIAEAGRPHLWENFLKKVEFLRTFGYLNPDGSLRSAAKVLKKIQFQEILVTELLLEGIFEDKSPEMIFGIMCGLVQTLPRTARVRPPDSEEWWSTFSAVEAVFNSDIVQAAYGLVQGEPVCTPAIMPLGEAWANGSTLPEILEMVSNPTDLSGDLVGSFRRGKDLVGQLRNLYDDDPDRRKELTKLIRAVTRDEVEVID